MSEWKTIDSAPKDGTVVALFLPWVNKVVTGYFTTKKGIPRWVVHWNKANSSVLFGEPSHWWPLPAPPSSPNGDEK